MSKNTYSLLEINLAIKDALSASFPDHYWISAEISSARVHSNGHCYLELVEKNEQKDGLCAQARATIWAFTYRLIRPYFETLTGQKLSKGIKILFYASVKYHELYGLSLDIKDIDPTYTLGDLEKQKLEIVQKLKEENIFDLNKNLQIPECIQRIAVISSQQAAGYEDFVKQLSNNNFGYYFHIQLFSATMQGDKAENSMIAALDNIYSMHEQFDLVVIVRGGGAQSDLSCFNNYNLPFHIAQFPLPVLTGIGHERDDSIADMVAYKKLKTPTAAAEFIINHNLQFESHIIELAEDIKNYARYYLEKRKNELSQKERTLHKYTGKLLHQNQLQLEKMKTTINKRFNAILGDRNKSLLKVSQLITQKKSHIIEKERAIWVQNRSLLHHLAKTGLKENHYKIEMFELKINAHNPLKQLEKGYSITLHKGKPVKNAAQLKHGERLQTILAEGQINSVVEKPNRE